MTAAPTIQPSAAFREAFTRHGGGAAAGCYQCATCSSVCELAPSGAPFPRRQVLWAQWGLVERLAADPGPWLCHQCNDCSLRCPRDVAPGDLMAAVRAAVVERLAAPALLGSLVGNARRTWPLLVLLPLVFWLVLLAATTGLAVPQVHAGMAALEGRFYYQEVVPHLLIYIVYTAAALWSVAAIWTSGRRFWRLLGAGTARRGSFLANLVPVLLEIASHRRFARCSRGAPKRRWGHLLVMWGFIGAALTSAILVVYLYGFGRYPLPLDHWVKWLGNLSAVALVVGGTLLYANRLIPGDRLAGATSAGDRFFLFTVLGVIATGVVTELLRFIAVPPAAAVLAYLLHLALVLTLFLTFPYSKFAHLVYRTLAMVHERMAALAEA
jgi:quinone-modifying oxidoreductase subunit QmoC